VQPDRKLNVGDKVKVSLPGGRIVDAVIKVVIRRKDGLHYQVDFGEQTAQVRAAQIVAE
jgi:hypothetical protein